MTRSRSTEASARAGAPGKSGTAEADEVARFQALAETWWDAKGSMAPLHRINPVRLGFIRERLIAHFECDANARKPFTGLTVLDIGCGGGLLCEPMARLGARVTGIDAAERNIAVAKLHAAQSGLEIDYRCQLPEDLAAEGARFEAILNMEVIEHVADIGAFAEACAALVKPGGAMVVATLNRTLKSLAFAKVGAEYVLRWLPAGTHDWRKFVKPSELARRLRANGMTVAQLAGMSYHPLDDRWSLGDDSSVNYLMFAVKEG
jgi:2-polyprenyl-6-hydroxyphenyl methylase/3-demethylubiquinone-9 3-methyltransferase